MDHSVSFLRKSLRIVKAELARLEAIVDGMPRREARKYDRRIEFARWHVEYLKERIQEKPKVRRHKKRRGCRPSALTVTGVQITSSVLPAKILPSHARR